MRRTGSSREPWTIYYNGQGWCGKRRQRSRTSENGSGWTHPILSAIHLASHWAELSLSSDVFQLRVGGHPEVWGRQRELARRGADRAVPSVPPRRLRSRSLSEHSEEGCGGTCVDGACRTTISCNQ